MEGYLTIQELKDLAPKLYTSSELGVIGWNELSDMDRGILLDRAIEQFESLKFRGRKVVYGQSYSFPRLIGGRFIDVNDNIKKAIVSLVISGLEVGLSPRLQAQRDGVKSMSTGKMSETYRDSVPRYGSVDARVVDKYLKSYIFKGVIGS